MLLSFFEEFPTKKNLRPLKLVRWPTKLYLAAHSVSEFKLIKAGIKNKYVKEVVYWPVLEKREGYWISPFSARKALQRIIRELAGEQIPVMLDLELPTTHNSWLYFFEFWRFFSNKRLISRFIGSYAGKIYTAEYYPLRRWQENVFTAWGLHYPHPKARVIKMLYHSMHPFTDNFLRRELQRGKKEWGDRFLAGYGVIYPGILGDEQILEPDVLQRDLGIAKEEEIAEVVVFRLGGLNADYARIMRSS